MLVWSRGQDPPIPVGFANFPATSGGNDARIDCWAYQPTVDLHHKHACRNARPRTPHWHWTATRSSGSHPNLDIHENAVLPSRCNLEGSQFFWALTRTLGMTVAIPLARLATVAAMIPHTMASTNTVYPRRNSSRRHCGAST